MNPTDRESIRSMLVAGLQGLTQHSLFVQGFTAMLNSAIDEEQSALCRANVPDSEVHRGRGRLGVLLELRTDFEQMLFEANTPKESSEQ